MTAKKVVSNKYKKISRKTTILALSIIVILSSVSYAGYYWKTNSMKARAAGWTKIRDIDYAGGGHIAQSGCKTAIDSAYGPQYKVQILTDNQSIMWRGGTVLINKRINTYNNQPVNSWWSGRYQINTVYTSRIYNDVIKIGDTKVGNPKGGSFGPDYDPRNFTSC